jgi:putative NIF3 family GTP cyclohydrolase 1 type 2
MNLSDILTWSARLAGCDEVPADSQVYVESDGDVKRVLFGIDVDSTELLWAQQQGYDAVIAHHPVGEHARMDFARVVHRQVDQMTAEGIDRAVAEKAVASRLDRIERANHMGNYNRIVDAARLIGMPLCNVHLACDIIGRQEIVDLLRSRANEQTRVGDVVEWLLEFPEMEAALTRPEAWIGDASKPLGRWVVAMAGGTNGGYPVFREYYRAGVDTVLAMHIPEEDIHRLRAEAPPNANLLITGHMATDSIGINRVIDGMEAQGISVTRTSGIIAGR